MKCEHCNKENPNEARFCWNCGEKLPSSKPGGKTPDVENTDILRQLDNLFNNN